MINSRYYTSWLRPFMLFGSMLFLMLIAWRPANTTFYSTGDVQLYQSYGTQALQQPIELPREYPALSAAVFVLPQLLLPERYMVSFATLMLLATGVMLLVIDRLSQRGWWLALYLVLGSWGIMFFRYDILVVLVTVLAYWAVTRQRWVLAQFLLALGVALKLYPLVLMPLVVLGEWHDERRLPLRSLVSGAVTVALVGGGMWLLTPDATVEMLRLLRERPIEFEAAAASVAWLFGPIATELTYGSINIISPLTSWLSPILTPLSVTMLLGVYLAVARGYVSQATSWAITLGVLLLTSKVFSTQYLLWLLPFVVLAGHATSASVGDALHDPWLWALICGLTSLVFPVGEAFFGRTAQLGIVTVRNALLVVGLLRLLGLMRGPTFLVRCWLALSDEARWWRRRVGVVAALAVCLVVVNAIMLRVFIQQPYMLDIGAWNDEEIVRYWGVYQQETDEQAATYRWASDWSTIRVNSVLMTARPLITLLLGGVPATTAIPRLVMLTADDRAAITLEATSSPRRYHLLLPSNTFVDGKLDLLLQSPTSHVAPDPRELSIRLDSLRISMMEGWSLPTPRTFLLQLWAIFTAAAVARRVGVHKIGQVFGAAALIIMLAVIAGRFTMVASAWQSRLLVVCFLCLVVAWGVVSPRTNTNKKSM